MKLGDIRKVSLASLLIMRKDLDTLKWVLKTTVCPLTEIFASIELCLYDEYNFETYRGFKGLLEYAYITQNLDLFLSIYNEHEISSKFVSV